MFVCKYIHVHTCRYSRRTGEGVESLALGLKVAVSCLMCARNYPRVLQKRDKHLLQLSCLSSPSTYFSFFSPNCYWEAIPVAILKVSLEQNQHGVLLLLFSLCHS